jgi:hypothetical protein
MSLASIIRPRDAVAGVDRERARNEIELDDAHRLGRAERQARQEHRRGELQRDNGNETPDQA